MENRITCCIPDCRRSTLRYPKGSALPLYEWICGKHWSLITRNEKRVWARHKRQYRKYGEPTRPDAFHRIWEGLKRRAAELPSHIITKE